MRSQCKKHGCKELLCGCAVTELESTPDYDIKLVHTLFDDYIESKWPDDGLEVYTRLIDLAWDMRLYDLVDRLEKDKEYYKKELKSE